MQRTIIRAVLIGLVAGLVVGVYHNIFTVPVIERAIVLEGERSAAELPPGTIVEDEPPLVSLGMQRIGMAVGTALYGAVLGLVFAGAYGMLRWMRPGWNPIVIALIAGVVGFWAISLLPFIKYPLVPPGVGEGDTLVFRQMIQTLFFFLSAAGVVGLILGIKDIDSSVRSPSRRQQLFVLALAAYGVFLAVIFLFLPGNPDPVPVPADLLLSFRVISIIGHLLMWALIAIGFAYLLRRRERAVQSRV